MSGAFVGNMTRCELLHLMARKAHVSHHEDMWGRRLPVPLGTQRNHNVRTQFKMWPLCPTVNIRWSLGCFQLTDSRCWSSASSKCSHSCSVWFYSDEMCASLQSPDSCNHPFFMQACHLHYVLQ